MKIKFTVFAPFNEVTGQPMRFEACTDLMESEAEAQAILATLPKSVGASVRQSYTTEGIKWAVSSRANLRSKKGNEFNETGIKRFYALLKVADCEMRFQNCINCFQTVDELINALEVK